MTRKNPFISNEYYHVYNRGTNKMAIFNDDKDYERFIKLLFITNSSTTSKFSDIETSPGRTWTYERGKTLVDIGAFCLMPNHFHLLIREKNEVEKGNTSIFLQRLLTSYSMYFNKKYNRNGSLFQGKSKSLHITNDVHLKYLFAYIHLNPVKLLNQKWENNRSENIKSWKNFLGTYKHSSYLDYVKNKNFRNENSILNTSAFPDYFSEDSFEDFINEWLSYKSNLTCPGPTWTSEVAIT